MENKPVNNIHFSSYDKVIQKPVVRENSVSMKLDTLRSLLLKYSKQYKAELQEKKLEEYKIKEMSFEWVEQTLRYYEVHCGNELDSVLTYLNYKVKEEPSKNNQKGYSLQLRQER